jgi:hypothetical protein
VTTQRITAPKNMTPITTTEATKAYRSGLGDGGLCPGCEGVSIQSSTGFRSLRQPGPALKLQHKAQRYNYIVDIATARAALTACYDRCMDCKVTIPGRRARVGGGIWR